MSDKPDQPLSRVAIGVATGLAALLVTGVIVASLVLGSDSADDSAGSGSRTTAEPTDGADRTGPFALVAVDAPDAGSPACTGLVDALPAALPNKGGELRRLPIAEPAPVAAAAWAGERGEPVVLRCGLGRPAELQPTAQLRTVSTVNWLPVAGAGATTWYTVDRTVYIALTVPDDAGTGPLQELSETIARAVPA